MHESESTKIQKIMRTKNVSQDMQLQEFITKIINLTTDSESNKIRKITRQKNGSQKKSNARIYDENNQVEESK